MNCKYGGLLALLLSACASHSVRCDRHLTPINAPARLPASGAPAGSAR